MTATFEIQPANTEEELEVIAALFEAYAASLSVDLDYQDFGAELASLPGKYAPPRGALLLARDASGRPLGCVGLRPIAIAGVCEMKRLFLAPEARGLGVGRALAEAVVEEARRIGYRELRLDTLATMTAARGLYRQLGFVEIAPYYAPTPAGTTFMALAL